MNFDLNKPSNGKIENNVVSELDEIVPPMDPEKPESVLFHFFLFILKGECNLAWKLFTRYSQQKILDTSYEEMQNNNEFYFQDEITTKEDLRRAFEENHKGLKQTFWYNFAIGASVDYMVEYAEYRPKAIKNNKTIVEVVFKRKDGLETKIPFQMLYEDTCWHFGLIETTAES